MLARTGLRHIRCGESSYVLYSEGFFAKMQWLRSKGRMKNKCDDTRRVCICS